MTHEGTVEELLLADAGVETPAMMLGPFILTLALGGEAKTGEATSMGLENALGDDANDSVANSSSSLSFERSTALFREASIPLALSNGTVGMVHPSRTGSSLFITDEDGPALTQAGTVPEEEVDRDAVVKRPVATESPLVIVGADDPSVTQAGELPEEEDPAAPKASARLEDEVDRGVAAFQRLATGGVLRVFIACDEKAGA